MEWKKTRKKKYEVEICKPERGTKVYNYLEKSSYITSEGNEYVIRGTEGEEWVVSGKKILNTYETKSGKDIELSKVGTKYSRYTTKKSKDQLWSCHLPNKKYKRVEVLTAWGTKLIANSGEHPNGTGDYLVCSSKKDGSPNQEDKWVVNGNIYKKTYIKER